MNPETELLDRYIEEISAHLGRMRGKEEELRELRDLRQKASAGARVSRELAGLDTKRAEEEFLDYAQQSEANDEFDALIGLSGREADTGTSEGETKIPES